MGHRALVAYERPDDTYNLHYTHWGGCNLRLKHRITEATPFGEEYDGSREIYEELGTAASTYIPEEHRHKQTEVRLEPTAVGVTIEEALADHLDFHMHEAFYIVTREFQVTAFRTFWLGFHTEATSVEESPSHGHGVICTVRWYDGEPVGDGSLRGWFAGAKEVTAELIDRDVFSEVQATTFLVERLLGKRHTDAETYVRRADTDESRWYPSHYSATPRYRTN
ncbi:DUF6735 family protein [Halobaculum sp. EA56]|uniref:DUF6735 family protein n=1 Tax=Halobaculum sp. EA56 TaxID=3421648 RepID=UPI003EC0521F